MKYVETSQSPGLIELRAPRIGGHTTSDPHTSYRQPDELAAAVANDPVVQDRDALVTDGVVDDVWLSLVEGDVAAARQGLLEAYAS
jgi:pyruvate dehydrogenase E1 component alpha subunit